MRPYTDTYKRMKRKDYILISSIALILLALWCNHTIRGHADGTAVNIYSAGELIGTYPLNIDTDIDLGHNIIHISNGAANITYADCPDKLCMHQNSISHSGQTIACLPNRLLIEVTDNEQKITYTGLHFDTVINVSIYDASIQYDEGYVNDLIRTECERYELICSRKLPDSELYMLNHRLISDHVDIQKSDRNLPAYKVSDELYDMIESGMDAYEYSDGNFDITIAPLSDVWHFGDATDIPSSADISSALSCVGADKIILCDDHRIAFTDPDTMIDLGGLAKGYIGDRLRKKLIDIGAKNAVIALGGNVVLIGDSSRPNYNVGIKKPFSDTGELIGTVKRKNGCVITSGTYERYFIKYNTLYHHILNPRTGYPFDTDLCSVTVICDSSLKGDILSTVLLSEGSEKAKERSNDLYEDGVFVILIDRTGKIIYDSNNYISN